MPALQLALDGGTPTLAINDHPTWVPTGPPGLTPEFLRVARNGPDRTPACESWVRRLERHWADATGRSHVVACRSGRIALGAALAALDLEPGAEIIHPVDAAGTARALALAGYTPVAVDLHPVHVHLDPKAVEQAITPRTAAVIAIDRHGTTADYLNLSEICGRHGVSLIEDGSRSLGAVFDQQPVGSHGRVSYCSLAGGDVRSSLGTAGLFATDDAELAATVRRLLLVDDHPGLALDPAPAFDPGVDASSGWSCQLSEIDAAVAESGLRDTWGRNGTRIRNGRHLRRALAAIPGLWVPEQVRGANHVYSSLPLMVVPDELGLAESSAGTLRDTAIDCLTAEGLGLDRWHPQLPPLVTDGPGGSPANADRVDRGPRPGAVHARGHGDFPVASGLVATGMVLGHDRCPFDEPSDTTTMDRIAECVHKVFVDNADRLRALTEERITLIH